MIREFAALVDASLHHRSGKVFYSGRAAFSRPAPLYMLGVNPGGDPATHSSETILTEMKQVIEVRPERWSAYRDESWNGKPAGTHRMQPRILHMMERIGHDCRDIPSSNLIFVRSARESEIGPRKRELIDLCWRFHQRVIDLLQPRVILCFGGTAGDCVRGQLGADVLVDLFIETNNRRWTSTAHTSPSGVTVVTATHPSIADWTNPSTDPTPLIQRMLER